MSDFVMPWGEYEGRSIEEAPSNYLHWLIANVADEAVVDAADAELSRRDDHFSHFEDD